MLPAHEDSEHPAPTGLAMSDEGARPDPLEDLRGIAGELERVRRAAFGAPQLLDRMIECQRRAIASLEAERRRVEEVAAEMEEVGSNGMEIVTNLGLRAWAARLREPYKEESTGP